MAIKTDRYDFAHTRGDTLIHQITVRNTDETPRDLTGATVVYTVRAYDNDGVVVVQKTSTPAAGVTITNAAGGVLQATVAAADMAALDPLIPYVYDCEVTIGGVVQTVQRGTITIMGDTTHA